MRIKKTYHYIVEHEAEVPWDLVIEVIKTTKGRRVGANLLKFIRRSKRREVYVLCCEESTGDLKVINAKIRRR